MKKFEAPEFTVIRWEMTESITANLPGDDVWIGRTSQGIEEW